MHGTLVRDFFLEREKSLWLKKPEGKILEFPADNAHAEAVSDGGIDIERFARNALLFFMPEVLERAHVVEAVGQFDEDHANVVDHRQQHFADVFRLAGLRGGHI